MEKEGSEEMRKKRERLENEMKKEKRKCLEAVEPNVLCNLEYSAV